MEVKPGQLAKQIPFGWIGALMGLAGLAAIGWGDLQASSRVAAGLQAIDQGALPQMIKAHRLSLDLDTLRIHVEALIDGPTEAREEQRLAVVAATSKLRDDASRYGGLAETDTESHLWTQLGSDLASLEAQVAALVATDGPKGVAAAPAAALRDELRRLVWGCEQLVAIGTQQAVLQSRLLKNDSRRASRLQIATAAAVLLALALLFAWAQLANRRHARLIEEHTRTLELVNAELEAFAGRIAHDLQAPLMPIQGNAQLIARGVDPDRAKELGERIVQTTGRVAELVEGLLAFAGGSKAESIECDAAEVLGTVLADLGDRLESSGAELEVSSRPTPVRCSRPLLTSVFQNLIDNALKYGRRSGDVPHVSVIVQPMGYQGLISVTDTGQGMPEEVRRRAFEPFFRGTNRGAGSGLGLATVRRIVEAHGGVVSIDSDPGNGTRLRVLLPSPGVAHA